MEKQSTRKFLKLIVALVALFLLGASALMLASCNKDEHQHSYTSSVTTPATCSNPGVETFTCSCGAAYTQIIPATNDHAWEKIKVYANSCESEGWTVYECSVCHEQKQDDWTPKLDHQYEAVETVEETCTKDGYQIMQCSYCGDRYTDDQYSSEHKATGHKWIANTDAEDPASDEDKKLGFVTVKEADCLNAAQLERKCSVCGHTEPKESGKPLGHLVDNAVPTKNLCKIDESLVDAEGNAVYAFECERENCPVEVVVDARGNTKHYIEAVDHKMVLNTKGTADGKNYQAATCTADGWDVYTCSVCGVSEGKVTEKTGHAYNTVKADGVTPVVVCEADKDISTKREYLDYMRSVVGNSAYLQNQTMYDDAWTAAVKAASGTAADEKDGSLAISCVCSKCGNIQLAFGHEYIIAKYVDGSSTDYEVDEETGLPVDYSDEVTVATMNCRYVQVCKNGCGTVLARGTHQNVEAATCRAPAICEDCGVAVSPQLTHQWISVADILNETTNGDSKDSDIKIGDKTYKYGELRAAYEKVVATETWMKPVTGDCDSQSTDVYVCGRCLVEAANGTEVTWNQATELPVGGTPTTATSTNAYVITSEYTHKYVKTYYTLDGTKTEYNKTNCEIGFLVKYVCSVCGNVFTNVAVPNEVETTIAADEVNEAENNEAKKPIATMANGIFTDEDGYVVDTTGIGDVKIDSENFTETVAEKIVVDKNIGKHELVLNATKDNPTYQGTNGYKPSTCVAVAKIPYTCENCGQIIVLDADTKANAEEETNNTNYILESSDIQYIDTNDKIKDPTNHAGELQPCGVHCKGVGTPNTSGYQACGAEGANAPSHAAVTIKYEFKSDIKDYYGDYTIQVAKVTSQVIDDKAELATVFTNYKMTLIDGTKIADCSIKKDSEQVDPYFVAPKLWDGTAIEKADEGDYLVLVAADGTVYPVLSGASVAYYTEDKGVDKTDGVVTPYDSTANEGSGNGTSATLVSQDDTYFVDFTEGTTGTKAPVSASDAKSLTLALQNETTEVKEGSTTLDVLTVNVSKSFTIAQDESDTTNTFATFADYQAKIDSDVDRVVFDLNGNTITFPDTAYSELTQSGNYGAVVLSTSSVDQWVFQNGTLNFAAKDNSSAFVVGTITTLTLNDVDVVSAVNGIRMNQAGATLNVNNSNLYVSGTYGIYTMNPAGSESTAQTRANAVDINVTDSVIMMNPNTAKTATAATDVSNTALYVDNFATVDVTGSTLSANRQALMVRSGEVTVAKTTLTLVDGFTAEDYVAGDDDTYDNSEDYYLAGYWGTMNQAPKAAVVVGDSSKTSAAVDLTKDAEDVFATVIFEEGVVINVPLNGAEIVIGSNYVESDLEKHPDCDKDEDDNVEALPVTVYFDVNGAVADDDIYFCLNYITGTVQLVGAGDYTGLN